MSSDGSRHGSSRMPLSKLMWSRLRSELYGFSRVTGTGIRWRSAYAIIASRPVRSHRRHGAMTRMPGSSA